MTNWFTERVDAAERLFLAAAERAGAAIERFAHPLPGPHGEPLGTAVARLGPDRPERMVVTVSGTHGIEGHAGSPIQAAALDGARGLAPPAGTAILHVHLINPWGCAWNRRENEENVDVFRNLLYADPPFAPNELYDRYEEGINPRAWEGAARERSDAIWHAFVDEHGLPTVLGTVRRGQHDHPKGMTYHGRGPSWSRRVVEAIAEKHLKDVPRVEVLDIHTGYGAFGEATFISTQGPGERTDRIRRWFAGRVYALGQDPMMPNHPRGPYHLWERWTGEGRVNMIGLEYGTYSVEERFELFRANTHIHTYGRLDDAFGRRTAADYRELFYPADPRWRDRVLEQGLDGLATLLRD